MSRKEAVSGACLFRASAVLVLPPDSALASYALARDLIGWYGMRDKGTAKVQLLLDWEGGVLPTFRNSLLNAWNLHDGLYSTDEQLYNTIPNWF